MSAGDYRVTLHISHPTTPADEIVSDIPLPTRFARSAGAPKVTKEGKNLGGNYASTEINFLVSDGVLSTDDVPVSRVINEALDRLDREKICQVVLSGAHCNFLIGVYTEENVIIDFDAKLMSRLSIIGISVRLDFYGGPESNA